MTNSPTEPAEAYEAACAVENKREKAMERAFKRRFPKPKPKVICFRYGGNPVRVSDPESGAWIDFDTSWWRIRAVAWNGPEPRT